LIRFRNQHPAFGGKFTVEESGDSALSLIWRSGHDWARLAVDLAKPGAVVTCNLREADKRFEIAPDGEILL